MSHLKIGVAQIASQRGDVTANLSTHLRAIAIAASEGVNYLVFPELSLTGYEPDLAHSLAFSTSDERLVPLIEAAKQNGLTVGVGLPLVGNDLPKIGLAVISPSGQVELYEKIYLHPGEEEYFSSGKAHHFTSVNGFKIANAICADTNNPKHAEACAKESARIYVAGVLFTEQGYIADEEKLFGYARQYNMLVAIANHNATTGGWTPGGKSAIWSSSGKVASADATQNALVVAQLQDEKWVGQVVEL
ncbi:MAG: carbon-nitrogen hydrolase family protein [Gammaproteobacteria bacterium]|nr:carbon-nitrogen hydrolase family protein [Gammaproteobacteria bacterium]MBU2392751.1 carbon-nitrogen hydrolase family protein [Gammaproteobacteria bacterium]MBU2684967.1 carbon-nitrogen hydrolase family protein [Gammaproteobacteria bacterium]